MSRLLKIIIVVLVVDILGLGVLWYTYSTMQDQKIEETELQKKLTSETQKSLQLTSLRRTIAQAEKESAGLNKYFYDSSEESQIKFVADMEALGTTTNTKAEIRSFDYVGGASPAFRGELSVEGEWSQIFHLLKMLESFPARLNVLNFSARILSEKPGAKTLWSASMSTELKSVLIK